MNGTTQAGYTLLEMLLVIGILSMTAFGMATLTEGVLDGPSLDQARFEETRRRLETLRKAVIGDHDTLVNGSPLVGGFVADMGRLPINLAELVRHPRDCNGDGIDDEDADGDGKGDACERKHDENSGLTVGWNGPYLHAPAEAGGGRAFRDGWGNRGATSDEDADNYGWLVTLTDIDIPPDDWDDTLAVQSLGSDLKLDPAATYEYAKEYPASGPDAVLVAREEHSIDLGNNGLKIKFTNPANDGSALPPTATKVCVRIYFPRNGGIASIASDENSLSGVPDGDTEEVHFTFSGLPRATWIPWGERAIKVFKFENDECQDGEANLYPKGSDNSVKVRTAYFLPHKALPDITWPVE
jgi:prepilin-type N-terminal cleavage/methylation domain-containing protein